jgi:hypothetical protein
MIIAFLRAEGVKQSGMAARRSKKANIIFAQRFPRFMIRKIKRKATEHETGGRPMPKASPIPTAMASGALIVVSAAALASPVTDADLRGKTICWSYFGTRNTYGKDGSFDSNLLGHGTWSLVGDTLTERSDHGAFTFTISREGQAFHIYGASIAHAQTIAKTVFVDAWGSYCTK